MARLKGLNGATAGLKNGSSSGGGNNGGVGFLGSKNGFCSWGNAKGGGGGASGAGGSSPGPGSKNGFKPGLKAGTRGLSLPAAFKLEFWLMGNRIPLLGSSLVKYSSSKKVLE